MAPLQLEDSIERVPGVGPVRAEVLRGAGIGTVEDLLLNLPLRYEDRSRQRAISELRPGEAACVRATVESCRRVPGRGKPRVLARVQDETGSLAVTWFNQPYVAGQLDEGSEVVLYGAPTRYQDDLQLVNPVFSSGDESSPHLGRAVPVYRRIGPIGTALLRRLVASTLESLGPVADEVPAEAGVAGDLMARDDALREVHYPPANAPLDSYSAGRSAAHRRLVLEEFIAFQTALALQRQRARADSGLGRTLPVSQRERVREVLPFDLTGAQESTLGEILSDLEARRAMHRLLQGDVGSGKTAVAACALLLVAGAGEQAALLAPTEILAEQHAATLVAWARQLDIEVALLTAATPRAERRDLLERLDRGAGMIVVGTHALLQRDVQFARLGLVVIDEQQRFGVRQRAALRAKGKVQGAQPDLLVMTATPIPRSLSLTLYGDLEVSQIDELPPGRSPVQTRVLDTGEWTDICAAMRKILAAGHQIFVVAPRIEDSASEVRSATEIRDDLVARMPEVVVELLHGSLDAESKGRAMRRFVAGEARLLVATTVVEVGVDVPAATHMIVENAERFGLAQLHQLRGRVGRGGDAGHCWLVAHGPLSETARARLTMLTTTTDGFLLAEEDLRLRGPGEYLGTRQAGSFELRVGDPFQHPDWLLEARDIAAAIAVSTAPEAAEYRDRLRQTWRRRLQIARAG